MDGRHPGTSRGTEAGLQAGSPCITLPTGGSEAAGRGQGSQLGRLRLRKAITAETAARSQAPGAAQGGRVEAADPLPRRPARRPRNAMKHPGGSTPRSPPSWPTTWPPPWPGSSGTASSSERATTPGRSPYTRGRSPDRLLGAAWSPGVDGVRGMRGRGAPHHRPTKERRPRGQRYGEYTNAPAAGGPAGRGRLRRRSSGHHTPPPTSEGTPATLPALRTHQQTPRPSRGGAALAGVTRDSICIGTRYDPGCAVCSRGRRPDQAGHAIQPSLRGRWPALGVPVRARPVVDQEHLTID